MKKKELQILKNGDWVRNKRTGSIYQVLDQEVYGFQGREHKLILKDYPVSHEKFYYVGDLDETNTKDNN